MDVSELVPRLYFIRFPVGNAYLWRDPDGLTLIYLPGTGCCSPETPRRAVRTGKVTLRIRSPPRSRVDSATAGRRMTHRGAQDSDTRQQVPGLRYPHR